MPARRKKLTKSKFGMLKPIEVSHKAKSGDIVWLCHCDCGNKKAYATTSNLNNGKHNSCGCVKRDGTRQPTFVDLTGKKFGKWKVIKRKIIKNRTYWYCKCECGNTGNIMSSTLNSGHSKSCGCAILSDLTDEIIEKKLLEYFKSNRSLPKHDEIPKVLGIDRSHHTLNARVKSMIGGYRNFIKKHNLEATTFKDYYFDRNYFSKIDTRDKAYFLGWIFTDGYLNPAKSEGYGSITLNITDLEVLESFKKYTKSESPIHERDLTTYKKKYSFKKNLKKSYSFSLTNPKTWNDCLKLGLTPRKTFTVKFPSKLPTKYYGDFLRGVFEGDGTVVYIDKSQSKSIIIYCANQKFLIDLDTKILSKNKIDSKIRHVPSHNLYTLRISSKSFVDFYDLIYLNVPEDQILKRKRNKFHEIVKKSKRIKNTLTTKQINYFNL